MASERQQKTEQLRRRHAAVKIAAASTPAAKVVVMFDLWRALTNRLPAEQQATERAELLAYLGARVDALRERGK